MLRIHDEGGDLTYRTTNTVTYLLYMGTVSTINCTCFAWWY